MTAHLVRMWSSKDSPPVKSSDLLPPDIAQRLMKDDD